MSNTRRINLEKLAEQLTGAKIGHDAAPATPQRRFPRVPFERFEELLLDAELDADARQLRLRAMLDGAAGTAIHYQGRPQ